MNFTGNLESFIEVGNHFNLFFGTSQQTKHFQAVETVENRYHLRVR